MKKYFKYFIYISFLFLAIYLYRNDHLRNFEIKNFNFLIGSFPLLFVGFIGQSLQWKAILREFGGSISSKQSLISTGLPIFGKYIPGKVWLILGRAMYVASKTHLNVKTISWISLLSQGFTLVIGILMSGILLSFSNNLQEYGWTLFLGILLLGLLVFSPYFPKMLNWTLRKMGKNNFEGKPLRVLSALKISPWFLFTWIGWSMGFWLLTNSITGNWETWEILSVFPISASLGIMAIFMPGGVGVREGVITGVLVLFNVSLEMALMISIAQRIWFLIGEGFIFFLGLGLNGWKLSFDNE